MLQKFIYFFWQINYEIDKNTYNKLLKESITTENKKSDPGIIEKLNEETYQYINKYNVKGKVKKIKQKHSYIIFKDHKKYFPNKLKCKVLNPSEYPFNKFTKDKQDRINEKTIISSKLKRWSNTDSVINYFNKLKVTPKTWLIKFNITKLYPSITKTNLTNS